MIRFQSILVLILIALLFNCQDGNTKRKTTIGSQNDSIDQSEVIQSKSLESDSFPKLNSSNAMEFFLKYDKEHKENKVRITTDFGDIEVLLFDETKFHRSNFIYLTKQKYFDNTQFYRIVPNFVIQAGNSDEQAIADKRNAIGNYLLPPDTNRGFKHERGVLSMPSSEIENAYKLASPFEFFIVQQMGGAHHLDGQYTIFGKVTKGMDVVDRIASQKTDDSEWPLHNIYIKKVEIIDSL